MGPAIHARQLNTRVDRLRFLREQVQSQSSQRLFGMRETQQWLPAMLMSGSTPGPSHFMVTGCQPGFESFLSSPGDSNASQSLEASQTKNLALSVSHHGKIISKTFLNNFIIINIITKHWSESKTWISKNKAKKKKRNENKNK